MSKNKDKASQTDQQNDSSAPAPDESIIQTPATGPVGEVAPAEPEHNGDDAHDGSMAEGARLMGELLIATGSKAAGDDAIADLEDARVALVVTVTTWTPKKKNGIRRCGVQHTHTPQEWPQGQFTAEQLDVLRRDPDIAMMVETPESKSNQA